MTFPLCVGVCGEREREEDGRLERRCSVKRPGQGGRPEEPGVSGAPTRVRSDGGEADGKKTQRRIKRTSVRRAVPVQNFSFFSRREVKGVDMLSGCN